MIYLYVKTHNITGLKYLGKTNRNPFKYVGSGKYWKSHIKKYGNYVKTEVLFQSESSQEIKKMGIYYSNLWNVTNSNEFANLCMEEGQGGKTVYTKERNKKISQAHKGRSNYWIKKGQGAGLVIAYDKQNNKNVRISKEEFLSNKNRFVGIATKNRGKPKSNTWKSKIKEKYKESPRHGHNIIYNGNIYNSIREMSRKTKISRPVIARYIREGLAVYQK